VRALAYRGVQTGVIVLVSALLAGAATFAPWYNRLVDDSSVRQAFEIDAFGSTWSLTTAGAAELEPMLPERSRPLFREPVEGRSAALLWISEQRTRPVEGGLVSREDVCAHLVLAAGRCPVEPGEVAVSSADAELYRIRPGMVLPETSSRVEGITYSVTGVYRLRDPDDPYWFGTVPTRRSGWDGEQPLADLFVTPPETFGETPGLSFISRLDVRVEPTVITVDELPVLAEDTALLTERARGRADVLTSMAEALDRLDGSRRVSRTALILMVAQVAVLALAVLNMLVGLALLARRGEIGLGRLRGRPVRRLVGAVTVEWLAVLLVGTAIGVALGWAAALAARSTWLTRHPDMAFPGWVPVALAVTLTVSLGLMLLRSRQVATEPIPALLRTTQPRSGASAGAQLVIDAVLVTAALAGLAVGLQSPEDSALVLLAPSLLAVAASVVLARVLAVGGAAAGRRWLARGRTARTLAAIQLSRPRGLAALLTVLCAATAFAVFSTQVTTVSERNREHRAEVEAGAPAVVRTQVPVSDLVRALDEVDPRRGRATAVVTTRLDTEDFVSLMLVEPGPFRRIAHGADLVTDDAGWESFRAPAVEPLALVGSRVSALVDGTGLAGEDGREPVVDLVLHYRNRHGRLTSASLGTVTGGQAPRRLSAPVGCTEGCELVRWRLVPAGGLSGRLALRDVTVAGSGPLDLSGIDWRPVLGFEGYELAVTSGPGSLDLRFRTGGLAVSAQHPWVPVDVAVLLSEEHPASATFASASVTTPGGTSLPLRRTSGARDAVPRALRDVAVGDLETTLRLGEGRATDGTSAELWLSPAGVADRDRLLAALADRGVRFEEVHEVGDFREMYDGSPEALTSAVNPAAAVLAVLLAVLGLVLAVSASWRSRSRDLAALRLVGVPRRTLLGATYAAQLVTVLAAALAGTACGLVGAHLALRRLPIFAEPEPAIELDLTLAPTIAAVVAVGVTLVLAAVAAGSAHWLVRRAEPARVRELAG
jgi:putative ABC transport system permease protein